MSKVILLFTLINYSFHKISIQQNKKNNDCFDFNYLQKVTKKRHSNIINAKNYSLDKITKQFIEVESSCLKDTIIFLSLYTIGGNNNDINRVKEFYLNKHNLIFYDSIFSTSKTYIFTVISYVNSNYTKLFLVSISKKGTLNYIIEVSSLGGDEGYYLEKSAKIINDSTFQTLTIEKETIFNEENLPYSLKSDSVITNISVVFENKILETKKYYTRKTLIK